MPLPDRVVSGPTLFTCCALSISLRIRLCVLSIRDGPPIQSHVCGDGIRSINPERSGGVGGFLGKAQSAGS